MRRLLRGGIALLITLMLAAYAHGSANAQSTTGKTPLKHIIVVYMENWSFDSLYGMFPGANGLANATGAAPQVDKDGKVYDKLPAPLNSNKRDANGKATVDDRFPTDLPNK